MPFCSMIADNIQEICSKLPSGVALVAVSKFHPVESIREAYDAGQRIFAESRPQEFAAKVPLLPSDIRWHFIGHLQTNKLKLVLPHADLVQSVDSVHLLDEIDRWGKAHGRTVKVLLELHVALEQSKQGFYEEEILDVLFNASRYANVCFCGLMAMATNTEDMSVVRADFERTSAFMDYLRDLFPEYVDFKELSIGMSGDWPVAVECGATMVRIGSAIFGERE